MKKISLSSTALIFMALFTLGCAPKKNDKTTAHFPAGRTQDGRAHTVRRALLPAAQGEGSGAADHLARVGALDRAERLADAR